MEGRTRREIERLVERAGLQIDGHMEQSKRGHIKCHLRTADGRTGFYVFPCSPSDAQASTVNLQRLRRFAEGRDLRCERAPR